MIRAAAYQSKFAAEPHLNLWLGAEPIQEWLHRLVPDAGVDGLVPAWLGWLTDEGEWQLVRERMWPQVGEQWIVPLLVCPDDLDFACTLVVAEVSSTDAEVTWERIGLDTEGTLEPSQVNWFGIAPQRFQRGEYLACVGDFLSLVGEQEDELG